MYKHIFAAIAACLLIPMAALSVHLTPSASSKAPAPETSVSQEAHSQSEKDLGAVKARLSQLLKLNRVFDNCLDDDRALIEEASTVLLDQAVETPAGDLVINQQSVLSFIKDLYGKDVDASAGLYDFLPAPEGFFAIPGRGYDTYSHEIENLSALDNGNFSVLSNMTVAPDSPFGYNIVRADIVK